MTYCTTEELRALSGTSEDPAVVLVPIIEAADREIDAYLTPYGLTGTASGACKQASLKLSLAALLERGVHKGYYQASEGGYTSSVDVVRAIESNRKSAYAFLQQYIDSQSTSTTSSRALVRTVRGR